MMKQCKRCVFYFEYMDEKMIQGDDDADVNDDYEHHYCGVYNNYGNHIPPDILNDEKKCKLFLLRKES